MKSNTKDHFTKHLKASTHGRQKYFDGPIKTVYHKCKICDKSLLCDHLILLKHFKWNHNLTPEEYCEKTKTTMMNCRNFPRSFLNSLIISKKVYNSCVFACYVCSEQINRFETFRKHIKKHNPGPSGPLMKYLVKGCSYQCKNCPSLMLCDRKVIAAHVRKVHKSLSRRRTQYEKEREEFLKETPISSKVWDKTLVPSSQIPLQEQSSKIGNLCCYICPDCKGKVFHSFNALSRASTEV